MPTSSRVARVVIALVALAAPLAARAQKRALTPADWDHWRSISGATLSADGRWALYSLAPQVGDGEMVVRATAGSAEYRVPRGYLGRPVMVAGGRPDTTLAPAVFTPDSRWAIALVYAPMADYERARHDRRSTRAPKSSLAIVSLANGTTTSVANVKSFRVPRLRGGWVAYLLDQADSVSRRDSSARDTTRGAPRGAAVPGGQPRPVADSAARRREYGATLVLRDLATGAETRIADVLTYAFDDSAKWLGYTVSSRAPERDGAYVRDLSRGAEVALASGRGEYKQLAFDRSGDQAAFVSDRDDQKSAHPRWALYTATLPRSGTPAVARATVGGDLHVSANGRVAFVRNGRAVLFGIEPAPVDSVPADSLADRAIVDIWNWKDPRLQPQQRLEAARDRSRSFQTIYSLDSRRVVQLANDSMPQVTVANDGKIAMAASSERYAVERMWGAEGNDVFVIDATTGARKLVRERVSGPAQLSPDGRFVAFFDKGHWYAYGTASGKTTDLTTPLAGVRFEQEQWDVPGIPEPYGIAGWTRGDRTLVLYDRYDLWEVDPSGATPARVVTDSAGRRAHVSYRVVDLDRDDPWLDQELLLRALDDSTKASGFWRDQLGARRGPERIVMSDVAYGAPVKARAADEILVTRGTFTDFPDLYVGRDLAHVERISDANPQQKDFKWGSVELVRWKSDDGVALQGLLYKPDGFDPSKKYPMITYYYERLSDNLHAYVPPSGRNVINPTHYVSNGYLIFEPDIAYETGYPGPSAVKSVLPGVQMLLARGYVDPNALGLQGQSWGGYQTAYIITQTHMFRAAMAGAPVANMTSAYGGIRWGSGLARAFQYETGQSRIGGSLWEYPNRYLENSPLFWLDKVTTPLLIMSNDADDAVPWYQGIELFVGMRRLGKEAYLLDYNGDVHNPTKRANQKDVALRMQQFFDHHLRGYPAPEWMSKGVPFLARGRDQFTPATAPAQGTTTSTSGSVPEKP